MGVLRYLIVVILLILPVQVSANSVLFSPDIVDQSVSRSSEDSIELKVYNQTNTDQSYQLELATIDYEQSNRYREIDDNELHFWMSFDDIIVIPAGEFKLVELNMNIPEDAPIATLTNIIYFKEIERATNNITPTQARIVGRIGIPLFITIGEDEIDVNANLVSIELPQIITDLSDINPTATIENTSPIRIIPRGVVNITAEDNSSSRKSIGVNTPPTSRVLAQSTENISFEFDKTQFNFGYYDVGMVLAYGPQNKILTASSSFLFVPVWLIITSAVIFIFILIIVRKSMNYLWKK